VRWSNGTGGKAWSASDDQRRTAPTAQVTRREPIGSAKHSGDYCIEIAMSEAGHFPRGAPVRYRSASAVAPGVEGQSARMYGPAVRRKAEC